jgi:NTE family protein
VFPPRPLTAGLGVLRIRDHSVPASGLRRLVERHVDVARLEEAPTPVHVLAADVLTGEEILLSSGPVVEALLASAAIPGVFPAVERDGRLLMDGGVVNNTPISHAVALGADRIYVLAAIGQQRLERAPRGALAAGLAAVSRAIARRLEDDVARYADSVELTVLHAPSEVGPTDFGQARELVEVGLQRARAELRRNHTPRHLRRAA